MGKKDKKKEEKLPPNEAKIIRDEAEEEKTLSEDQEKDFRKKLREIKVYYKDKTRLPRPDGIFYIYCWKYIFKEDKGDYHQEFNRQKNLGIPTGKLISKLEKLVARMPIDKIEPDPRKVMKSVRDYFDLYKEE